MAKETGFLCVSVGMNNGSPHSDSICVRGPDSHDVCLGSSHEYRRRLPEDLGSTSLGSGDALVTNSQGVCARTGPNGKGVALRAALLTPARVLLVMLGCVRLEVAPKTLTKASESLQIA
eukprot:4415432-Amphidinium_carterae.1